MALRAPFAGDVVVTEDETGCSISLFPGRVLVRSKNLDDAVFLACEYALKKAVFAWQTRDGITFIRIHVAEDDRSA